MFRCWWGLRQAAAAIRVRARMQLRISGAVPHTREHVSVGTTMHMLRDMRCPQKANACIGRTHKSVAEVNKNASSILMPRVGVRMIPGCYHRHCARGGRAHGSLGSVLSTDGTFPDAPVSPMH